MATFQKLVKNVQTSFWELFKNKITYFYLAVLACIVPALFCEWLILPAIVLVVAASVVCKFDDVLSLLFFLYPFFAVFVVKDKNLYFLMFACVVLVVAIRYFILINTLVK